MQSPISQCNPQSPNAIPKSSILKSSLESLANTEVDGSPSFEAPADLATIQLEPDIEPNRPESRLVPDPEADRSSQLAEIEIRHAFEHVAAIHEGHGAEIMPDVGPQLPVEN